jgi:hypothetical protein
MALALNKLILAGSNATTNTAGAYWQNANIAITTAANVTIPAGLYYANTPANCTILANMGSYVTVVAANSATLVLSDGVNTYANCTTNGTLVLITVNGGESAPGTFTS